MASFTIRVYGGEDIRQRLIKLGEDLLELGDAFNTIGQEFLDWYSSEPFVSEGGIYGNHWPELAPSTLEEKAEFYPGKGMLQRTGLMQNSFFFQSGTNFMMLQNSSDYIDFHQFGTRNMPQRIVAQLTEERARSAADIVQDAVATKIERVGL